MKTFPATRWLNKPRPPHTEILRLAAELNFPHPLAALLLQRGVENKEQATLFFRPTLQHLHDPFLMRDMDKAVERIRRALGNPSTPTTTGSEKILVYGDYDVDGTTAVALVYSYLQSLGAQCGYYIPDRYREGYGISFEGIDYAAEHGYSLIIALDCGIKSHDKVAYAKEKNIDFVICDHHRPGETIPAAVAVLDPKRNDCTYPYDELCGCGIGFKLVQALHQSAGKDLSGIVQYLDLVAVAIAADIVPVTGENRVLAKFGLQQINTAPRPALKALFEVAGLKKKVTITDLVFTAAPRINAAGRVDHGKGAVELLISPNAERATETAKALNAHNNERRDLDKTITAHAMQMIQSDVRYTTRKSTVVYHPDWHKGVVGIVASRLIEQWYRPTIVLTGNEGKVSGSARSVRDFDVHDAIEACSDLLIQFGGHKYAAGLTLKPENVEAFIARFDEQVTLRITEEQLLPVTEIDYGLSLSQIDNRFVELLKMFEPFGPGNMNPVFLTHDLHDRGWAKVVGENHLKCSLYEGENRNAHFAAIGFGMGEFLPDLQGGKSFSACYTVEENHWNGMVSTQMNLKDVGTGN